MTKKSASVLLSAVCVLLLGTVAGAQKFGPVGPPTVAAPVITGLYPSSAKAGSPAMAVFVTGQNFYPGITLAQFNGSPRATVVFNSQVLAFEATTADLAAAKTATVKAVNTGHNVTTSNMLPFLVLP